jgi:hypothetical protein
MKKLAFVLAASVIATVAYSQVVTIRVTQLADNVGYSELSPAQILLDTSLEISYADDAYDAFSYEIDFTNKVLILKNKLNTETARSGFIIKYFKSKDNFDIEFADPNNEFDNTYGLVVLNKAGAVYENNDRIIQLLVFKSVVIF